MQVPKDVREYIGQSLINLTKEMAQSYYCLDRNINKLQALRVQIDQLIAFAAEVGIDAGEYTVRVHGPDGKLAAADTAPAMMRMYTVESLFPGKDESE